MRAADSSICPRCQAGFRCGVVAGDQLCWCASLPPLAVSPSGSGPASCFCPACLEKITFSKSSEVTLPLIEPIADAALQRVLQHKIDHKTKPPGALGRLESLAIQLGLIQRSETPALRLPQILVFAADHGIAAEGVSAYPQSVTVQMVGNMLSGGAAVNVFARQHGFALQVIDAGVAAELPAHQQLQPSKIARGTRNVCVEPAMSRAQAMAAIEAGMACVRGLPGNVLALGEMGIANTSSAALLLARLADVSIDEASGRGTGLDDVQLAHKRGKLAQALALHAGATQPLDALAALGGFEIAMMAGAMLQAAAERRVLLIDGFIAGSAALVACALCPAAQGYMIFCHRSAEHGHGLLLAHLRAEPLLDLGLRLGEGTGALLVWPLLQAAVNFVNQMASFESAGVSGPTSAS